MGNKTLQEVDDLRQHSWGGERHFISNEENDSFLLLTPDQVPGTVLNALWKDFVFS